MAITITLPDGRSMREALAHLRDEARSERTWCDENGRSSRAEAFERFALTVEAILDNGGHVELSAPSEPLRPGGVNAQAELARR